MISGGLSICCRVCANPGRGHFFETDIAKFPCVSDRLSLSVIDGYGQYGV